MRAFAALLLCFAVLAMGLPLVEGQDAKEPDKKSEVDKKPEEKKKSVVPKVDEATVVKSPTLRVKLRDIKTEDMVELTVTTMDLKAKIAFDQWQKSAQASVVKGKGDLKSRLQKFQTEVVTKLDEVFSGEERKVTLGSGVRIRTMFVPPVFDKDGNPKKLTSAQLNSLKSPRLPGYVGKVENLKVGQIIDLYYAKQGPAPKTVGAAATPKKGPIGSDPNLAVGGPGEGGKLDILMVLVVQDAQ